MSRSQQMDIWSIALRRNTHPIESARAAEGLVDAPGDVRQAWLADLFFRKDEPNPDPITHCPDDLPVSMWQELASPVWTTVKQTKVLNGRQAKGEKDEKHICPLQLDVIERCLTLYSNPGDLVLDPFNGIGSTGYQAVKMNRKYIGVELKPEYAKQAAKFLAAAEIDKRSLFDLSESFA